MMYLLLGFITAIIYMFIYFFGSGPGMKEISTYFQHQDGSPTTQRKHTPNTQ